MDRQRSRDTGSSSRSEETRSPRRDEIRRRAESSRRNDAESSIERTPFDEREVARAQALERGRNKMQRYQQEANCYKYKDRDTFNDFKMIFEENISELENNVVKITSLHDFYGKYENKIDVNNGKIIGIDNYQYANCKAKFHFSEIVFNQLCLAMKYLSMRMSEFDLKCWYGNTISNEETIKTAKLFFPEERDVDGSVKEGEKTFLAGTDAFMALAGTPTAQSKFYLLAQHPKVFKDKKVTSITVIRQVYSILDINYEFGS